MITDMAIATIIVILAAVALTALANRYASDTKDDGNGKDGKEDGR